MQPLHNVPVDLGRAWADVQEHNAVMKPSAAAQFNAIPFNAAHAPAEWTAEFASNSQMHGPPSMVQQPRAQGFRQQSYMSSPMYGSMNQGFMFPATFNAGPALVSSDKGKGKARDIDFDAAFAELDQALGPSAQETARIEEFDDVADLNEAMERMAMRQQAEAAPAEDFEEYAHFSPSCSACSPSFQSLEAATALGSAAPRGRSCQMGGPIQGSYGFAAR